MLTFSEMPPAKNLSRERISTLVSDLVEGRSAEELLPLIYDELRRLAQWQMGHEAGHTLQPTALVHEAYLRLRRRPIGAVEPTLSLSHRR